MEALVFVFIIAMFMLISIPIWCLWGYLTLGGAFKKAGMPWWYSIIPIFNQFAFYKLVYGKYSTLWKVIGLTILGGIAYLIALSMRDNIAVFMVLIIAEMICFIWAGWIGLKAQYLFFRVFGLSVGLSLCRIYPLILSVIWLILTVTLTVLTGSVEAGGVIASIFAAIVSMGLWVFDIVLTLYVNLSDVEYIGPA